MEYVEIISVDDVLVDDLRGDLEKTRVTFECFKDDWPKIQRFIKQEIDQVLEGEYFIEYVESDIVRLRKTT